MTARKRKQAKSTGARLRATPLELPDDDSSTDTSEQEILAELEAPEEGVTHQIRVFQLLNKPNGQPEETYLFEVQPQDLSTIWDRLRDTPGLGSGTYRIRVRQNSPGRSVQIYQRDRAVKCLIPVLAALPAPAAAAAPDALTARLVDRLEQLLSQRPQSQAADMMAAFGVFTQMQANLIAASPAAAAPPATSDAMEIFRAGVEFAREIGAPGEKGMGDIVTSLLPLLEKFAQPPARAAAPALPAPSGPAAPGAAAPLPVAQQYLMELVNQLGEQAKQNVDPADAADYVFENAPIAMVRQICDDAQLLDRIAMMVPVVASYRGFFNALRAELQRGMIVPDDGATAGDAGEPASESGERDTRNAQMDAPAGS